jgi:hypothetical protein
METLSATNNWNTSEKILFRFFFIFFSLFTIIGNNGANPFLEIIVFFSTELLDKIIPWIGKHILQLSNDISVIKNDSGDTTYNYVVLLTLVITSLLGTIVWTILDKKRTNYVTLYYWLTVVIRYYVGLMLIQYGLIKIIKLQFPSPNFYRLSQNYGDSSPMGLAWTFLGFSKGYNLFMGIIEVSSILLLFRRTMTFGAIITLTSTLNIMAVNYFFDVPVKIVSTALVIMTIFLLSNNIKQLWLFFFTGESVSLSIIKVPEIKNKWLRNTKLPMISLAIILQIIYFLNANKEFGDNAPKPKLYGLYNVYLYTHNNDTIPPLMTDSVRWSQFEITQKSDATIRFMTNKQIGYTTKTDTLSHKIQLLSKDSTLTYSFVYENINPDKFILKGTFQNDSLAIFMTRKKINDYLLMNRGFHWINEYPFNK